MKRFQNVGSTLKRRLRVHHSGSFALAFFIHLLSFFFGQHALVALQMRLCVRIRAPVIVKLAKVNCMPLVPFFDPRKKTVGERFPRLYLSSRMVFRTLESAKLNRAALSCECVRASSPSPGLAKAAVDYGCETDLLGRVSFFFLLPKFQVTSLFLSSVLFFSYNL